MKQDPKELARTAVFAALEEFSFAFAEEPTEPLPKPATGDLLRATIRFSGPAAGELCLAAPAALCGLLAANILGVDLEDLTPEAPRDALCELLNVTCGLLVRQLGGAQAVFDLSIPAAAPMDLNAWQTLADEPAAVGLLVEDTPVLARLHLVPAGANKR